MRFSDPLYALLILPLAAFLFLSFKQIRGLTKARKRNALIIRSVLLASLIVALMGPQSYRANKGSCTIFLVDRSDSIRDVDRDRQEKFLQEAISKRPENDSVGIVVFGSNALIESAPAPLRSFSRLTSIIEKSSSDVASAVRLASAMFPDGKSKRIVILTDGNETKGDARSAAQVAASDQISIDVVALGQQNTSKDVSIASVELPDSGRENEPFDLRITVDSQGINAAKLRIDRDGVVVAEKVVSLQEGKNTVLIPQKIDRVGLSRYRVTVEGSGDSDIRNNIGAGFINVKGRPKILLIQSRTDEQALFSALNRNGIAVDLVGPSSIPSRFEQLQAYDSIIFNDVNAQQIPVRLQSFIASAAQDSGIGLGMIGGENSFLPGGWYGSPVTEALPVDLNIRQKKSIAAASVLIIVDCSGSMGMPEDGQTKLSLASRAAEETIKMLGPMDRIGLAGSSNSVEMVVPMQSAEDKESAIRGARELAVTGGGIYVRPSIQKAYEVLSKETSKTRHFILLGDGADSTDWEGVEATALAMRAEKITISVVAIGDGKDVPNLKRLAALGGGRFYLATKASQLPAIFTQDTAVMSRSAIEEGAFLPKITQFDEAIRDLTSTPPLLAYCLVEPKPLAKMLMKTPKDDPLLLTGRSGLAGTFAFTSDSQARWAKNWMAWGDFGPFWSQLIRSVARQATKNQYQVSVDQSNGKAKVVVTGTDSNGNPLLAPETPVRIAGPDGKSNELILTQTAPGKYESEFETRGVGSYIVSVVEKGEDGAVRVQSSGTSVAYPAEYRATRTNQSLLSDITKESKGKEISKPEEVFRPATLKGSSLTELFPFFLTLALLLLPFDIAVRRIVVPFRELLATRRRKTEPKPEPISNLNAAKSRAQRPDASTPVVQTVEKRIVLNMSEPQPIQTKDATEGEPEKSSAGSGNTSASLLEAKRKRQNNGE